MINEKIEKPSVVITQDTDWKRALNAARRTIGKSALDKQPTDDWKRCVLMAEHSPIKLVEYTIQFKNLRQWVGVHLLRHDYTLPFIHSQRVDRRNVDEYVDNVMSIIADDVKNDESFNKRDYMFQGQTNDQDFVVNAQTLINISRKRLCNCASRETREAWRLVHDVMKNVDPVMAEFMVPNCVYRGFCPEMTCCGFCNTDKYKRDVENYRALIRRK